MPSHYKIESMVNSSENPGTEERHLDVREYLEQGGEPYSMIMSEVSQLAKAESLFIHAPFEPKPLINQLKRMGFETSLNRVEPDHFVLKVQKNT